MAAPLALTTAAVVVAGLALGLAPAGDSDPPPKADPPSETVTGSAPVDAFGDPLPPGAIARLGTVRFRTADFPKQLAISPDGKRLVSTASFQQVRLAIWEADTGRPLREVEAPGNPQPEAICWPADGRGLAAFKTGMKDYVVWEFTDSEARPPVGDRANGFGPGTFSVSAFSPDGTLLAAGELAGEQGTAGKLQVWPVHPGRPVRQAEPRFTLDVPDGFVALSFMPDGKRLLGITQGRQPNRKAPPVKGGPVGRIQPGAMADTARVFVWDVATWKEVVAFDITASGLAADSLLTRSPRHAVSPDGTTLYTPTRDAHVKATDLATGKERFDVLAFGPPGEKTKAFLPGFKTQIGELGITPDGKTVIVAELMGRTVGLDAATGKERWRGGREIDSTYGLAFFPDGKRFALGHGARQVGVYDTATGKPLVEPAGPRGGLRSVGTTPDGQSVLTAGWDGVLRRWELATGRLTGEVAAETKERLGIGGFSADGKRLVGPGGILDTATGKVVRPLPLAESGARYQYGPTLAAWLPDGSVVLSDGRNAADRFSTDGKKLVEYVAARPAKPEENLPVAGLTASPDGKTVLLAGEGAPTDGGMFRSEMGWVTTFDAATGTRVRNWQLKGGSVTAAAYLPDGSRVVLGRWIGRSVRTPTDPPLDLSAAVTLFDPASGEAVTSFDVPDPAAQDRWVRQVAVAPTGAQVAVAEQDLSLTVYELATGSIRRRWRGHRGPIEQLAFTADGSRLVTVSDDGTGLVWDMTPPRPATPASVSDADRLKRWATLLASDAQTAHRAMGELAADPAGAVAFLKAHLKPTPVPADADVDRLIAKLGAAGFADRESAARDLDGLGGLAVPRVKAQLKGVTSAEVRQRLEEFLKRHDRPGRLSGPRLRELRAVELLEMIGTPEARAVLAGVSEGDTPLAKAAAGAAKRLAGR